MIRRAIAFALAASLVAGLPGEPFYSAFAQTAPIEAPVSAALPEVPLAGPEAPTQQWQQGLDQVVSFEALSVPTPAPSGSSAEVLSRTLEPALRVGAEGARRGRSLAQKLERFGSDWERGGRALHAASDDEAGAKGYENFRSLLSTDEGSTPAAEGYDVPLSHPERRQLAAASETPAPDPKVPGKSSGPAPPAVRIPLGASIRYYASYYGSGTAACLGLFVTMLPFHAAGSAGLAALAGLLIVQLIRGKRAELRAKARGGKELYTAADLEAALAQPNNAQLAPAIRKVLEGLSGAEQLSEFLRKKLGGDKLPLVGWYRPVPYNLSSWGDSTEAGWVGLGENVLTEYLKRDWKIVAGGMAHELGHLHFGDWRRFTELDQLLKTLFAWTGVSAAVRKLTGERMLTGQEPLKDRFSIGAIGVVLLTAAKAVGLVHASWLWLAAFPAAWALMLAAALLKQAYMRAQEFRADQFSAALTHPSWMVGYLLEIKKLGIGKETGWLDGILGSHPTTISRIRALGYSDAESTAPPAAVENFEDAWSYLDSFESDLKSARAALEDGLGLGASVDLVWDGKELVFSVFNSSKALPPEHAGLRVVQREEVEDPTSGEQYYASFRSDLRRAQSEVESWLLSGQSVQAAHSEQGFFFMISGPGAAESVKKLPPKISGFPVVPSGR